MHQDAFERSCRKNGRSRARNSLRMERPDIRRCRIVDIVLRTDHLVTIQNLHHLQHLNRMLIPSSQQVPAIVLNGSLYPKRVFY